MIALRLSYKKKLYRPVSVKFDGSFCYINDFYLNQNLN